MCEGSVFFVSLKVIARAGKGGECHLRTMGVTAYYVP